MVTDLTKPLENKYACPSCSKMNQPSGWVFQGVHFLANARCPDCQIDYYHTLPIAHTREIPVTFSSDGKYSEYAKRGSWLAQPLIASMVRGKSDSMEINQVIFTRRSRNAILVNCLDTCFGHVFTKLCNLSVCRNKYPDRHLVAVLPEKLQWLIPPQIDEAWLVRGSLSAMNNNIEGLDEFVRSRLGDFDSLELYPTSIFADAAEVDYTDYLKVAPYDYTARRKECRVTFILREDRFWPGTGWEDVLYKSTVKLKIPDTVRQLLCKRQNKRVLKVIRLIQQKRPDLKVAAAGIGQTGKLDDSITDRRLVDPGPEDEKSWLELYADSDLVIGVHGSNMILPGIQAGAMVELVPEFKIEHIGETTLKDYPENGLCRHLLGNSSPRKIALVIEETLKKLD